MMEKQKLRQADIFSGAAIAFVGAFIISQGVQMPMKDSWGGVQNVWYVSPALFPLFIGTMLLLLGVLLVRTALKEVGVEGLRKVISFLFSRSLWGFLQRKETVRYYGATISLLIFVFLLVPRVDFFLAAVFFLLSLFTMFYCGDHNRLVTILKLTILAAIIMAILLLPPVFSLFSSLTQFPADYLVGGYILLLMIFSYRIFRGDTQALGRFKLSLGIALAAPFTVGIIFKYFLLVPMPFEGIVVALLDALWYADFWS